MRAPVTVTVQDTAGVWRPLPDAEGVRFSSEAPGGAMEATIPLPDTSLLPDLQQGCAVRVTDGTTGETLWTGRLSSPVRQLRGVIESGEPSFEGQACFLGDSFIRYTPLVTRLDAWWTGSQMKPMVAGAAASSGGLPVDGYDITALMLTLPSGYIRKGDCSLASFHGFYDSAVGDFGGGAPWSNASPYGIRGITFRHREGAASGNRSKFQVFLWHGQTGGSVSWSSNAVAPSQTVTHGFDPDFGDDVTIGFQYNGASVNTNDETPAVTSDELWAGFWEMQVFRQLYGLDGYALSVNPATAGGLRPAQIVEDLLGHFANPNFGSGVNIDTSALACTFDNSSDTIITSYDFSDMATPADILTDLMALVPSHYWTTGNADTDGKFPVSWLPWSGARTLLLPPGAVTYDVAASDADLASQVQFVYLDTRGREVTEMLYALDWDYPDLLTLPHPVEAPPLDLTDLSSYAAAKQVATAALAENATLPKSATAMVSVPVPDKDSGALMPPWTLAAGWLAHVPETGETLRVTKVEVDVDTATATLTLGTPRRTVDQIVSSMSRYRKRGN